MIRSKMPIKRQFEKMGVSDSLVTVACFYLSFSVYKKSKQKYEKAL